MPCLEGHVDGEGLRFNQGSDPTSSIHGLLRANTTLTGSRTWTLPDRSGTVSVQDVQFVSKGTDTSVTADTTVNVDPVLSLPVEANSTYLLDVWVVWTNAAGTAGFKWGLGGPDTTYVYNPTLATEASDITGGTALTNSSTQNSTEHEQFIVKTGANSGDLAVYWSQKTSDAGATTLKGVSSIELRKVS